MNITSHISRFFRSGNNPNSFIHLSKYPSIPLLLCILLFIFIQSSALNEIRYVSKTGSSTPPYLTWATAADSIMEAISISNSGDTIYVGNGEYQESVTMIAGLSLIGSGMDSCIINSAEVNPNGYSVRMTDSCYLKNFTLIPSFSSATGRGVYIYDTNIPNIHANVEYIRVENGVYGIRISSSSLGVDTNTKVISKNIILNVEVGIVSAQTKPLIIDNLIYAKDDALYSQVISSPTYLNNTVVFDQN